MRHVRMEIFSNELRSAENGTKLSVLSRVSDSFRLKRQGQVITNSGRSQLFAAPGSQTSDVEY